MRITRIAAALHACAALSSATALSACATLSPAAAPRTPSNGTAVLQRMHDAYAGRWYHTLTFTQKTTQRRRDGTDTISTWYESLRYTPATGTQLRIDLGPPAAGNGVLYTADSSWRVRGGTLASAQAGGNEFLPMIEGVYMQPVSRTAAEVANTHIDMQRVSRGMWEGRPVWIIGAFSSVDTTSPQFWVDIERNVVVRMILSPAPGAPSMDIHLDNYVPLSGGWLATRVAMSVGGVPRQTEEYRDWSTGRELPPGLFEPATWTTARHWASPPNVAP
jgi:hypothetical protein